mmetsp:Transcript_34058/g.77662  ORF Transcript_34058/g.77662 Transcript_34058/m.77662 type:complete len:409 (+) Transcript_34058:78-1304(+)
MQVELPSSQELSDFRAWVNITKSGIGLLVLMMPRAFASVGIVPGCMGVALACAANMWGIAAVAKCRAKVEHGGTRESDPLSRMESPPQPKRELLEPMWDSGYGYLDKVVAISMGTRAQLLCVASLLGNAFACGVSFVATLFLSLPRDFPDLQPHGAVLATGFILMALSLTNRLRYVAFLSAAALLMYVVLIACLLPEAAQHRATHFRLEWWKTQGRDYGTLFALVIMLFTSLPVCDLCFREMQNKSHFVHVASGGYLATLLLGMFVGLVGYVGYGYEAEEVIYLNFTGLTGRICAVVATVVLMVSYLLQQVPLFMFLQAQLPGVHYIIINSTVVWLEVFVAYALHDVTTCVETLGLTFALLVCCFFPCLAFLSMSHRYERVEQCVSVATILLGVVCGAAAYASALSRP